MLRLTTNAKRSEDHSFGNCAFFGPKNGFVVPHMPGEGCQILWWWSRAHTTQCDAHARAPSLPPSPDSSGPAPRPYICQTSTLYMPAPDSPRPRPYIINVCQKVCQIECQILCQIECQKMCQIGCQIACQIQIQNLCPIDCQNMADQN